jgi:hypothetical protein
MSSTRSRQDCEIKLVVHDFIRENVPLDGEPATIGAVETLDATIFVNWSESMRSASGRRTNQKPERLFPGAYLGTADGGIGIRWPVRLR